MPLLAPVKADIDSFIAHPRTFMRNCVAELGFQSAPGVSGGDIKVCGKNMKMTLKQDPGWTVYQSTNQLDELGQVIKKTMKFYKIVPATGTEPSFDAYYCPYEDDTSLGVVVGPHANFMFTPLQNGCSLGIGSAGPDGSRLVFHANKRNVKDNVQGQRDQLKSGFQAAGHTIEKVWEKSAYMFDVPGLSHLVTYQLNATSFGARNPKTGSWHFYSQIHEKVPPGKIYLRGLKSMKGTGKPDGM
ncbi:MAG: hypothetical protein IBJ03_18290 [Gemmatimonadaceae bacterium]|nr:hypothetical protein [Gemmatimonadaceae bacterium]